MNSSAKNKLTKILSDNKSGSTEVLLKLVNWCKLYRGEKGTLQKMISITSRDLSAFSAIQSFIKELNKILNSKDKYRIENFLIGQSEKIKNRYEILFINSLPYLKDCKTIVTLSNSKTISKILKKLNEHHKIYSIIGESRPQFEGRILAKELLKNKIKVEILPDVLLTNAVEKSDVVVIGADAILANGDIVNKTGSRNLAVSCKYFKKPFYVLATSDKISNKTKYIPESQDGKEIWNYNHQYLKKTNYYFEVIEKKLITKTITDS